MLDVPEDHSEMSSIKLDM